MSLGAFMAGVLLSDSEYRHELQADIEPFEGLLLGFFFISVGMSTNLDLLAEAPGFVLAAVAGLLVIKAAIGFGLARLAGQDTLNAARFAAGAAAGQRIRLRAVHRGAGRRALAPSQADRAMLIVTLSMVVSPLLFTLEERFLVAAAGEGAGRAPSIPSTDRRRR